MLNLASSESGRNLIRASWQIRSPFVTMAASIARSLRTAVSSLQADPDLIHEPELAFFKDYLESLGARIPAKKVRSGLSIAFHSTSRCHDQDPDPSLSPVYVW